MGVFDVGKNYDDYILGAIVSLSLPHFLLVLQKPTVRGLKLVGKLLLSYTRVGTLIVATIYLQLIQNRYMFRSFTVLQCSHQHCVQTVASDVEVVGYL